jgi:glycosyltransferase involved in cell wall biosynthesis
MITSSDPDNDIRIQKERRAIHSYRKSCIKFYSPVGLHFPKPIRFIFWQLRQYRKIPTGCDVIHCHDLNTLLLGILLKRKYGGKLIYDSHEYYLWMMARFPDFVLYPYFRALQYIAQWYVDTLIVISDTMKVYFEARYKFKQIVVVRNTQ